MNPVKNLLTLLQSTMTERSQIGMSVRFDTVNVVDQRNTSHTHSLLVDTWCHGRVLFMDSEVQFAESDEHRYHEMLIHPTIAAATPEHPLRVLILGGGDGLAAREVLKWGARIHSITIVDYDDEFVSHVSKPLLGSLNVGSLEDPRVTLVHTNAVTFARHTPDKFDVIVLDLPDPDENGYAQLYTDLLYACQHCLEDTGVLVTHTGAMALDPSHPCWVFLKSLRTTVHHVYGNVCRVHFRTVHVPSFIHPWGFFYITSYGVAQSALLPEIALQCRFLDPIRPEHTLSPQRECIGDRDIQDIYYGLLRQ